MNKKDNQRHEKRGKKEVDEVVRQNEESDHAKQRMAYD